jgi:hypothetical protein
MFNCTKLDVYDPLSRDRVWVVNHPSASSALTARIAVLRLMAHRSAVVVYDG